MVIWFCPYSRKCVLLLQYFHLIHDVVLAYICTHIRSFCHCPILSLIPHSHFSYEILDYGECYKICSKIEITKNIFFAIYQKRVGHSSTDKLTWLYYNQIFHYTDHHTEKICIQDYCFNSYLLCSCVCNHILRVCSMNQMLLQAALLTSPANLASDCHHIMLERMTKIKNRVLCYLVLSQGQFSQTSYLVNYLWQ